ncbi:MAG: hypothetical protein QM537_03440 [Candidatus Symbiobacter sp.]|nr:hypothetical protein [Candidatus Symbiobacter sp.]
MPKQTKPPEAGQDKRARSTDKKPIAKKSTPPPKTTRKKPLKEMAQTHTGLALETLAEVAARGNDEKTRLAAAEALLDRAWGKPQAQAAAARSEATTATPPMVVKVDTGIRRDSTKTTRKRKAAKPSIESQDHDSDQTNQSEG